MPRERKPADRFTFKQMGGTNPTPPAEPTKKKPKYYYEKIKDDGSSDSFLTGGYMPILAPTTAVVAPTTAVAEEYWGNDENTVFVETLTPASRVSLRWEQEHMENTVRVSATGQGVHTVFADV